MDQKVIKEALSKKVSSIRHFDRRTYEVILRKRKTAEEIAKNGGDVQEFFRTSETSKTDFYKKNGGAYCELLSLLCEAETAA